MTIYEKKWVGGLIAGLVLGWGLSWLYLSEKYIDKELSLNEKIQSMLPQDLKAYTPYNLK